ncbi:MAG: filamentous hemagglutinin N-terminal domain-containing protein [Candidatus Gastranaerophilales bacterium]|nr:filamentous hemagglutinin N-terminal domain-containing protein [Candidatus Gastranaerophilales bacterium]
MRQIKNNKNIKRLEFNLSKFAFAVGLAVTVSLTSNYMVFAQAVTSDNLPIPNSINNATLQYGTGTVDTSTGNLGTVVNSYTTGVVSVDTQNAIKTIIDGGSAPDKLNIKVGSDVAQIDYNSFNVNTEKNVNFHFSDAAGIALNRVTLGNESNVLGSITQTGNGGTVYLINPNGILFGSNSVVNLNSFFASTHALITNPNLLKTADMIEFERGGSDPKSGIYVEQGATIGTKTGSDFNTNNLALISNVIYNNGTIKAGVINFVTGDGVNFEVEANGNYLVDEITETEISDLDDDVVEMSDDANTELLNGSIYHGGNINTNSIEIKSRIDSDILGNPFAAIVNIDGIITADASSVYQAGSIDFQVKNMHDRNDSDLRNAGVTINSTLTANSVTGTPYFYSQLGAVDFEADKVILGASGRINYGQAQFNVDNFTVNPNFTGLFSNNTGSLFDVHLATMADDLNPFTSGHIDVYNKINDSKGIVIGKIPIEPDLGFSLWKANVDNTGYDNLELMANTTIATQGDINLKIGSQHDYLLNINSGFNIWDGYDSGNEARSVTLEGTNLLLGMVNSQNALNITDHAGNSDTGLVIGRKLVGKDLSITYDQKDNFPLTTAILQDDSGNFKISADNINFINSKADGIITLASSITDTRSGTLSFKASDVNIASDATFSTPKDIIVEDTVGNISSTQVNNYLSSLGSTTSDYTIKLSDSTEGNGIVSINNAIDTTNRNLLLEANKLAFDADVTKGKILTGSGDLKLTTDHILLGNTVLGETADYTNALDDSFLSPDRFNFNSLELALSNPVYLGGIDFSARNSNTGAGLKVTSDSTIGLNTGATVNAGSKDLMLNATGFMHGIVGIGTVGTPIINTNLLDKLVNTGTLSLNLAGAGNVSIANLSSSGRHFIFSAPNRALSITGQITTDNTHNLSLAAKNITGLDQVSNVTIASLFGDHKDLNLDISYASNGISSLSIGDINHIGGDLSITTYANSDTGNIDFAFTDGINTNTKNLSIIQKNGTMRLNNTNLNKLNGALVTLEAQNGNIEFRASSGTEIDLGSNRHFVFKNTSNPNDSNGNGLMFTGSDGDGQEHYIKVAEDSSLKFESDNNTVTSLYFQLVGNDAYVSADSGMLRLFGVNDSTLKIGEIKAPGDIYLQAKSIQAKGADSLIESEAGQLFKGGLYFKADSIFTKINGSNIELDYVPTIKTSNAGIIFAPKTGNKLRLTSDSSFANTADTLFVFTDSFNKVQASEGFPILMLGDGNNVDITSSDFHLGKTENGVANGEIALVANTTGNVNLTFDSADVLSTLSVDKMNPFNLQRNIDEGTGEASSVYIHDATKNAFVRVTYDGTFFTYGNRTLIKDIPTVGVGREDIARLLMRLAPGLAADNNIDEILKATSIIAAVPTISESTASGTTSTGISTVGNLSTENVGTSAINDQGSNIVPVGDISPIIPAEAR